MGLATKDTEILIGKVDDCFLIAGRGCVVAFDFNHSTDFKINDEIKLVTPKNEIVFTKIVGIEWLKYKHGVIPNPNKKAILIDDTERNKQKYEKGTEIYLI